MTSAPPKGVRDEDLDRLYRGPYEEFTSGRNALAKQLKEGGRDGEARWVKALKKPTRAAWLVNQLSQRKPAEVKKLLEAGEQLRRMQEDLRTGAADRDALRKAAAQEQKAVGSLLKTAEAIGREHKSGSQILDRVGETLQAAASDPEVARAIELGRLDRERRAAGLGLVGTAEPKAPAKKKGKDKEAAERRAREQLAKRRKEAEGKVTAAEKRLARRRTAVENARDTLEEREAWYRETVNELKGAKRELEGI